MESDIYRWAAFISEVQMRLSIMTRETKKEPLPGRIAAIKRFFGFKSGWREIPAHTAESLLWLSDLAHKVHVKAIPGSLDYAARSFIESRGDPEWVDYEGCGFSGPNAVRNAWKRREKEIAQIYGRPDIH